MRMNQEELEKIIEETTEMPKSKKLKKEKPDSKSNAKPEKIKKEKAPVLSSDSKEKILLFVKTKTFLGICCLALAAIVAFGVVPLINVASDSKITVLVAKELIAKGTILSEDMFNQTKIGGFGVMDGAVSNAENIIGKYAAVDIVAGDIISVKKLSISNPINNSYLSKLEIGKQAIAITIPSLAVGVADTIEKGDIVSCIFSVTDKDNERIYAGSLPPELQYIRVLDIKDKFGNAVPAKITAEEQMPAVIVLEVNDFQAEALAGMDAAGSIHLTVKSRGDELLAEKLLKLQAEAIESLISAEKTNSNSSEFSLIITSEPSSDSSSASAPESEGQNNG